MIKVGKQKEPIAEKIHLGWAITSPGKDPDNTSMMWTRNSMCDHDQLCRPRHPPLHNNKNGSLSRLGNLIKKLRNQSKEFEQYDQIIQLSDGIIEKAPKEVKGTEFYIPHKPVVREEAESTKMRIVYGASAKSILFKSFIKWMPTNWTTTSELVVECSHTKSLSTSSAVLGYQTSLPTSAYQGRGSRCNSFSLVGRQRSESDKNLPIYQSIVWACAITIHLGRNTYCSSWRLQGEISNRSWRNTEKLVRRWCHFRWEQHTRS